MASPYRWLRVKDGHERLVGLLFQRQLDVMDRSDRSLGTDYSTPAGSACPELCVTQAKHLTSLSLSSWKSIGIRKPEMFLVTCLVHDRHSYLVAYRKQRAGEASVLGQQSEWPFWNYSWPSISMGHQRQIKNTQKKKLPKIQKKKKYFEFAIRWTLCWIRANEVNTAIAYRQIQVVCKYYIPFYTRGLNTPGVWYQSPRETEGQLNRRK